MRIKSVASLFCICLILISSCVPLVGAEESSESLETSNASGLQNTDLKEILNQIESDPDNIKNLTDDQLNEYISHLKQEQLNLNDEQNNMQMAQMTTSSLPSSLNVADLSTPSDPKLNSPNDAYSTGLYSGAAAYTYELQVPDGIAGFQPILSLSYNSHSAGGTYGWLGDGWSLNENYIQRKVKSTPTNIADDTYHLVFNGAGYDLIYNPADGLYHTEIESHLYIKKESGGTNQKKEYWTVKSNDGTIFRFGYNADSELVNPVSGRSYVSKWYLDQAKDVNGNLINYTYVKNPTAGEISATYLNSITYNSGQALIQFTRSPKTTVFNTYTEGCQYKEMNVLTNVSIFVNSQLVRRYAIDYNTSNNHILLNSVTQFGSDNVSSLPPTSFTYSERSESFYSPYFFRLPYPIRNYGISTGAAFADITGDGLPDFVLNLSTPTGSINDTWINYPVNHSAIIIDLESINPDLRIPAYIMEYVSVGGSSYAIDAGVHFVDLNGDGFVDMVQNSVVVGTTYNRSWINDGKGNFSLNNSWRIPVQTINNSLSSGVNFIDINGDGLVDIVQNTVSPNVNNTWINTGSGFALDTSWRIPVATLNYFEDQGVRFVDINGDGLVDIVQNSISPTYNRTWINTGSGFVLDAVWNTPAAFVNNSTDQGTRLMDLNGDGLLDIAQISINPSVSKIWVNTGSGFSLDNTIQFPAGFAFTDGGLDLNYAIIDINGDGLLDLISEIEYGHACTNSYFKAASATGNDVPPYRLVEINHSMGSKTLIEYDMTATFDNKDANRVERLPVKMWVVSSVTTVPGASQENIVTNYSYSKGYYHTEPKGKSEFRGFNKVVVSGPNQATVEHYFHQTKGMKGLEYRTYTISDSLPYKDVLTEYQETVSNGIYKLNMTGIQEKLYSNDGTYITLQTNYTYDSYGNVLEILQKGDLAVTGDERKTVTEYVYSLDKWILTSIKTVTLYDSSNQQVSKSTFYYDGSSSVSAIPSKGLVTKIINWNNQGLDEEIVFEYNSAGNLVKHVDGNGFVTKSAYANPQTSVYPSNITNAKNQTSALTYDPLFGNLLSVSDPNGFTTNYKYDVFGRLQKIICPYDSVMSPTIEYTFYLDMPVPKYIKTAVKDGSQTIDTYQYFDGLGNVIKTKTIGDNDTQYIQEMKYNQFGMTEITAPYALNETKLVTKYKYDGLGNLILIENPNSTMRRTNYDGLNVTKYDENYNKIRYVYDVYQNIRQVIEYNGYEVYETSYEYDTLDQLIKIIPHQSYDQSNVSFVESGNGIVYPDYYLLDSRTAVVQIGELGPGEEMILTVSKGSGSGTQPQTPSIFSFYDNFNTADGWKNTQYTPLNMPSHPGFIEYSSSYIDGMGLSYNYSGSMEGGEFWYISDNKDVIKDGYVFYARMAEMPSMGAYQYNDGYYFSHIGMGNRSTIMTGYALASNGSLYIAKYFPSYLSFILDSNNHYFPFEFINFAHDDEFLGYNVTILGSTRLYKLEYNAASNKASYYIDGLHHYTVNDLEPANASPVSMFSGAQNARNSIDYIIGYKYYPNISKSQIYSNGNIELKIKNTGTQAIKNANVDFNISNLNLQNQSLSSQTLAFTKPGNVEITTFPYSSSYKVANTTFTYNSLGQQTQMNDPDLGILEFAYDLNGNIIKKTDNKGIVTLYEYDALNRITKINYPTDADIMYEYDNGTVGTLSKVTSEIMTRSYTYDQRLRVIEEKVMTEADMYTRGDYNIKYTSSEEPELPIPNPIIKTVYGVDEITEYLHEDGFYVSELKFTDLRVAMFMNDVADLYLNGNLILKFVDHAGGGDLFIYDSVGTLVGVISPVNGNREYENITFDLIFTIDGSNVSLEIEKNQLWPWSNGIHQFNYSFDIGAPISDMYFYLDSSWDDYTYIDCTYEITYERENSTGQPDPQTPVPGPAIFTFVDQEEVLAEFNETGFYVSELNLTDFRVSLFVDCIGYVYLNNYETLRFVDDAGGGALHIYDLCGNELGVIGPVNGNPYFENVTFNISFVSDLSNIYLQIDRNYYGLHSYYVYSFPMNESISDLRLYHNDYSPNFTYLNGTYKATYARIPGSQPPGSGFSDPEAIEEINGFFRVSDNQNIPLSSSGHFPTELNLKNLKTILGPDTNSSVYINNIEMLRFENSSQNGTLYVLDGQNNVSGMIHNANGDPNSQNTTFDVSFEFESSSTTVLVTQYSDGVLVDTYTYSCASLEPASAMKVVYDSNGSSVVNYTTSYQYDSMNRVTNITYPNGQNASFTYDGRGMLKSIPGVIDNIEYNSLNLITKKVYPNGVTTNLVYDNVSKQLSALWSMNNQSQYLQHFEYEFDNVSNVAKITDHSNGDIQNFVYDDLNRLVMAGGSDYYQYYAYNPLGAMLAAYDGMSITRFEHGTNAGIHAPTKVDDASLIYDANGNLIEDGQFLYVYDEDNFLRTVKDKESNDIITEYWYDENGLRVKKLEHGRASYNINSVFSVEDGKNSIYYFANGERVAKETADGLEWYLNDYLGSTNVVVDETGSLFEKISYYPFGGFRSVYSEASQKSQQVTVTNLFREDSFTVEKEYNSLSVAQYVQRFGVPSSESRQMDEKLRDTGYEPQNLIANLYDSYNIEHGLNVQSKTASIPSFNQSSSNNSSQSSSKSSGSGVLQPNSLESSEEQMPCCKEQIESCCEEPPKSCGEEAIKSCCEEHTESCCEEAIESCCEEHTESCCEEQIGSFNEELPKSCCTELANEFELSTAQPSSLEMRVDQAKRSLNNSSSSSVSSTVIRGESAAPPRILVPSGFKIKDIGTNQTIAVYQKQDLIDGHKYYIHSNLAGNGINAYIEQFESPASKTSIQNTSLNSLKSPKVNELLESDSVTGVFTHRAGDRQGIENLLAINMDSDSITVTSPVLIDLTATFGAGNEPSVEWCYENIPYFTGTQTITVQGMSKSTNSNGYPSSKYTYTGKEFDSGPGLYYYGARYYNPATFTFTQADSLIPDVYNPQALNRYSYTYNNPVTYTDPDGHMPLLATAAIGAVVGGVVAGGFSALTQYMATGEVDMKQVTAAAVGGAVAGGIFGLTMGLGSGVLVAYGGATLTTFQSAAFLSIIGSGTNVVAGMAGRAVESYMISGTVDKDYVTDKESVLLDFGFGALGGIIKAPGTSKAAKAAAVAKQGGGKPVTSSKIIIKEVMTEIRDDAFMEASSHTIRNRNTIWTYAQNLINSNVTNVPGTHYPAPANGYGCGNCGCENGCGC